MRYSISTFRAAVSSPRSLHLIRSNKMMANGNVLGKRDTSTRTLRVSPPPLRRKIESTTTQASVNSFFGPSSQKPSSNVAWTIENETLLVGRAGAEGPKSTSTSTEGNRVASFDLDGTIITSRTGKQFSDDPDDWKWWNPVVPSTLKELHGKGYQIVIFSNQGGINLKPDAKTQKLSEKRLSTFKKKLSLVLGRIDFPITLYAATAKDRYRKPCPGMWETMIREEYGHDRNSLNCKDSFFAGDAGGRTAIGKYKRDLSCSDRNFAFNVGLAYFTPEEIFLKEAPRPFVRDFDPATYIDGADAQDSPVVSSQTKEIALLCGSPGAGKSTFYWNNFQPYGYERINQDTLKSRERCISKAIECLAKGKSVVIDNTNADAATRGVWVTLARQQQAKIRCFHLTASAQLCHHNNVVRAQCKGLLNPENRALLPGIAFTSFASRFKPPTMAEGFDEIVEVNFAFKGDKKTLDSWKRYWV